MKTVTATQLKANVSAILGDVERGETVAVTRHGKVVARIAPDDRRNAPGSTVANRLEMFRRSLPKTGMTARDILALRDEGRNRT